jgi:hypothetical protein
MSKIASFCKNSGIIIASLFVLPSLVAQAQWTPIVAKITESRTITKPDKSVSVENIEGYLYRSADGSQTDRMKMVVDGKLIYDGGTLLDNKKLIVYEVNYLNKTVREVEKLPAPRKPELSTKHDNKPVPEETVDGIKCYVFPVILAGKEIGKMWVAKDYKITIKSDYEVPGSGSTTRVQNHAHDIQANHEPDHKVFEIDPSFRVEAPVRRVGDASQH